MSVTINSMEIESLHSDRMELLKDLKTLRNTLEKRMILRNRVLEIMAMKEFSILLQIDDELVEDCEKLLERAVQRNDSEEVKKAAIEWRAARVYRDRFDDAVERGDEAEAKLPDVKSRIERLGNQTSPKEKGKFRS